MLFADAKALSYFFWLNRIIIHTNTITPINLLTNGKAHINSTKHPPIKQSKKL